MSETKAMTPVPDLDGVSAVFGDISHMPKYATLPEEFQRTRGPYCGAAASWFYSGCKFEDGKLLVEGRTFIPKDGVDAKKALRAVGAILRSFAPKHEHKMAGAGFLLSEWFTLVEPTS